MLVFALCIVSAMLVGTIFAVVGSNLSLPQSGPSLLGRIDLD